jgi:chloramphenicol 3-O phosphotransferase
MERAAFVPPVSQLANRAERAPMAATSRIVVLNGNSSVGKSSIARALQAITIEPFLSISIDAFLDMMPPSMFEGPDGLVFETRMDGGKPSCAITVGPLAERTLGGMRHAMAALADAGNNLIVDDAMMDNDSAEYAKALYAHRVSWVGVHAPLEVLEERERRRGDRDIGLARWLFDRVHKGVRYDLELDTGRASAIDCAARIKLEFNL